VVFPIVPGVLNDVLLTRYTVEGVVMASVTVTLSDEDKDFLARLAQQHQRSDADLAADALRAYLRFEEDQISRINAGIAAAKRGDFATEQEIEEFFSRYSGAS
jgi:predicted transcriptional regulator